MDTGAPLAHSHAMTSLPSASAASVARADAGRRTAVLRRLALLCAVLVLAITSLSAFIRLNRAGLSCDDAPDCYGQSLRQLQQGLPAIAGENAATAAARLVHRLVASAALLLVITMVAVCIAARPVLWREGSVALTLLALALCLAVLGRWSGDARVPAVAMGNLLGGFAMLALCWRLARRAGAPAARGLRAWAGFGVALLACQVALGGLVSASFAATSCTNLADCLTASVPLPWSALDPWREPLLSATPPINASGALAQAAHRLSAIAAMLVLLPLGMAAWRSGRRRPAALLLALLATQATLGLLMSGSAPPPLGLALAHNIVAALLLATAFDLARANRGSSTPAQ